MRSFVASGNAEESDRSDGVSFSPKLGKKWARCGELEPAASVLYLVRVFEKSI